VLAVLLSALFVAASHSAPCTGPFNASYSAAHLVYRSEQLLGGVGAMAADFARANTSALWLASKESARIYRLGETTTTEREREERASEEREREREKFAKNLFFFRFFSRFFFFFFSLAF
jgi:hypothetical protein